MKTREIIYVDGIGWNRLRIILWYRTFDFLSHNCNYILDSGSVFFSVSLIVKMILRDSFFFTFCIHLSHLKPKHFSQHNGLEDWSFAPVWSLCISWGHLFGLAADPLNACSVTSALLCSCTFMTTCLFVFLTLKLTHTYYSYALLVFVSDEQQMFHIMCVVHPYLFRPHTAKSVNGCKHKQPQA
jgi:hypothetical protein